MNRSPVRVLAALVMTALVATGLLGAAATATAATAHAATAHAQAPTNPSGFVRLGHLAPKTGPVDIYLTSFTGGEPVVIRKAPYGSFTEYDTLAPGRYTVAMRPADAPASSAPMLSTEVDVVQGGAYTVLATGMPDALRTTVVSDELAPPPADVARVRLIQGSPQAQELTVQAVGGPLLARDVAYGAATGYANVPAGRWTLSVTNADGAQAMTSAPVVDLKAGTVNSLVVTDTPEGGFAIDAVVDAAGIDTAMAPAGGVETGAGGAASDAVGASAHEWTTVVAVALAAALVLALRRRGVVAIRR